MSHRHLEPVPDPDDDERTESHRWVLKPEFREPPDDIDDPPPSGPNGAA